MILRFVFVAALLFQLSFLTKAKAATTPPELVIYTYDSMLSKGGLVPAIFPVFEKRYHCKIRALAWGEGGQIVSRIEIDAKRGKPTAHLVMGVDQSLWPSLKPWAYSWENWEPTGYSQLVKVAKVEQGFLPYDYSYLSLIADSVALKALNSGPPRSLKELLEPRWKRNVILQDPRTSTPGLGFFLFTHSLLGDATWNFWRNFKSQWLTLTPSWDSAYHLFLKGEAPLVWSYVTSQAYHQEHASAKAPVGRYQVALFEEGQPLQVEGAVWIKREDLKTQPEQALLIKQFLEYLISPEVQKKIPKTNWMLPVRENTEIPESFRNLPKPIKTISIQAQEVQPLLNKWNRSIVEK